MKNNPLNTHRVNYRHQKIFSYVETSFKSSQTQGKKERGKMCCFSMLLFFFFPFIFFLLIICLFIFFSCEQHIISVCTDISSWSLETMIHLYCLARVLGRQIFKSYQICSQKVNNKEEIYYDCIMLNISYLHFLSGVKVSTTPF